MNLTKLFKEIKKKEIVVIGDLILDYYIWGVVDRISPEAPVPIVEVKKEEYNLGGAANVAANIVAIGAKATVVGIVGNDFNAEIIMKLLKEKGINSEGVFKGKRPTTVKTRVIAHDQQIIRFDKESSKIIKNKTFEKIKDFLKINFNKWDAIIISDYKKGVVSAKLMRFILEEFKKKGMFVAVDPKIGNFRLYKGVSLITPNLKEAAEGAKIKIKDEKTLFKAGQRLLKKLKCDNVLITKGKDGMSLFFDNNSVIHIPTVAKSVYDVTGAGDTVIGVFTTAYISGATLKEAAIVANNAAGIVVSKVGTATAKPEEIKQYIKSDNLWKKHINCKK